MEYPSDVEIVQALRKRIKELEGAVEEQNCAINIREYRIKELEDGACRFNCRTVKEAFIAGAHAVLPPIDDEEVEFIERKYREWRAK